MGFEHVNINPSRFLTSYLYLENWNKIFTSESDSSYVPTVRRTAPGPNLSKTLGLFLSSCGALTLSTVTFRLLLLIFRLHAVRHVVGVVKLTCYIICKISFALFQYAKFSCRSLQSLYSTCQGRSLCWRLTLFVSIRICSCIYTELCLGPQQGFDIIGR